MIRCRLASLATKKYSYEETSNIDVFKALFLNKRLRPWILCVMDNAIGDLGLHMFSEGIIK
jgi:hypothetical protein